jgi:hypothetical protein
VNGGVLVNATVSPGEVVLTLNPGGVIRSQLVRED